ncbi:MAG: hypothetical protein P1V34_05720 [Alphaproteobacteria bacterium]|nr:hypothetical protein [Alphaproteobacteria bacterium]
MTSKQQPHFNISTGDSVALFLVPDGKNKAISEKKYYEESFQLPHVFQLGQTLVGITQKQHVTHVHGGGLVQQAGFFYTSYGVYGVLSSYDLNTAMDGSKSLHGNILTATDYSVYDFRFCADMHDIWDFKRGDDIAVLVEAIRRGCHFRAVIEKKDGTRQLSPIEMPYFWRDQNVVQFQTKIEFFPSEILDVKRMTETLSKDGYPLGKKPGPVTEVIYNNVASTYLSLFTDGRYYSLGQVKTGEFLEFENLTVFSNIRIE